MSDRRSAIMDVAERLIRAHGYNGFSFREIADEIGIKSASVHYHFPTKADLAAAVAKRYRERFEDALKKAESKGAGKIEAWRDLFQKALNQDGLMCLCGILAAEGDSLPPEVAKEAHAFLKFGIESLNQAAPGRGLAILSQLEGAMLIARSAENASVFQDATKELVSL
ncbi:MAG: TetR/AcrR family transcriptional regulator [Pseudomonadota bacterium]